MSEPQKVYVVTSGCHSAYSIDAVCSTLEKAESVKADLGNSDAGIEIFVLDDLVDWKAKGYKSWWLKFDKDGTLMEFHKTGYTSIQPHLSMYGDGTMVATAIRASSIQEAVKIASELRFQKLVQCL